MARLGSRPAGRRPRRSTGNIVRRTLAAAAVVVLAAGCAGSGGGADGPTPVRVGATFGGSDIAFFIAQERGYFAEAGLAVELVKFASASDMIAPLGAGQIEVAGGAPSAGLFNALSRDVGLKIVADKGTNVPGQGYFSLLVRRDLVDSGQFTGFGDLAGRKIGFTGAGNTTQALVDVALDSVGREYADAGIGEEFLGFTEQVTALQNGSIEAGTVIEPFASRAVASGAAVAYPGDEFYPDQQVAVVMYGESFIDDDPEVARRFMVAYMRAARDYNDAIAGGKLAGQGSDAVIATLVANTAVKDPQVHRDAGPAGLRPDVSLSLASMERDLAFWKSQKLIEGEIELADAVDTSFVEAALAELGPYQSPN
jgi:NitT/TauT family transport system substrate-binding protein